MSKLSTVKDAGLREILAYRNNTRAVLAMNAAGAATLKTTSAIEYVSNGILKTKTALSAQAFTAGHAVVVAEKSCFFVVGLTGAGSVKTFQGAQFALDADDDRFVYGSAREDYNSAFLPDVDDGYTPIGIVKIETAVATTFTPGTTLLDAAGITATYYDVAILPAEGVDL